MKAGMTALVFSLALCASSVLADNRPTHFEGKASPTLETALTNLAEANAQMAKLLADGGMSPTDHAHLHELTYTAENALEKLSDELEDLQESLETLHLASERADSQTVVGQAPTYLERSQHLFGR